MAGRAGTAWLALNRHGAAIAIVSDGLLIFSKELEWQYRPGTTPREELLQRYTLIAHLAPELRHGIEAVRQRGHPVDAIVTCGDLPDLRSLTMPLIEELDIEVETLDTLEGLDVNPAVVEAIGDRAPAMRLSAAAGMGRSPAAESSHTRVMAAAAALVLLAALGWGTMRVVTSDDAADPPRAVSPGPAEPERPAKGMVPQRRRRSVTAQRLRAGIEPAGR